MTSPSDGPYRAQIAAAAKLYGDVFASHIKRLEKRGCDRTAEAIRLIADDLHALAAEHRDPEAPEPAAVPPNPAGPKPVSDGEAVLIGVE